MKTYITLLFLLFSIISFSQDVSGLTAISDTEIGSCNNATYSVTRGVCSSGFLEFTVTARGGSSSSATNASLSVTFSGNRTVDKSGEATGSMTSMTSAPVVFTDVLSSINNTTNMTKSCTFRTMGCDATEVSFNLEACNKTPTATKTVTFFGPVLVVDPCNCDDPQNEVNPDGSVRLFHDVMTFTGDPGDAIVCASNCGVILDNTGAAQDFGALGLTIPLGSTSLTHDFWRVPGNYSDTEFTVGGFSAVLSAGSCDGTVCNNNIPTMGEWGLIILSISLLILGVLGIKVSSTSPLKA